jgi:hypothetical protein
LSASIKHRESKGGTRGEIPYVVSGVVYSITSLPTKNSVGVYYRVALSVLGENRNGV